VSICLFLYNLETRDFWAPDEGDFSEIVRELDGNLIVPHLNGKPYGEKPPLFYYITYLSKKVLFWLPDEVSLRVPGALFATILALLFFVTIWRFLGKQRALCSTAVLITAPLYYWQARYLQVDMVFAVFVSAALLCFLWFYHLRKSAFLYTCSLCLALAFMTKGPLALVLVVPIIVMFLAWEHRLAMLSPKEIALALIILLALILPWYAAIYFREGWAYLQENVVRQNITRFFDAWSHRRPVYYYLTTLPLDFFPWSLFLPFGLYLACKESFGIGNTRFFLVWFLWMFFFLSLSSGKVSKYMLPLIPSISLFVSFALLRQRNRYNTIITCFLSFIFLGTAVLLFFYMRGMYPEFYGDRVIIGIFCLLLSVLLFLSLYRKEESKVPALLFASLVCIYMSANVSVYEKWNHYKSPRPLCEKVRPYVRTGVPWVYYGSMRGVYVYYIGTPAIHVDEHRAGDLDQLKNRLPEFFVLTRERDMKEVRSTLGNVDVLFAEKIGDTLMVFSRFGKSL
jgi:4-amino-4-deoxy-L-arabinose transferase-like glycosyltransferase